MTRMPLNKGQKVLVKKHNGGTLMGTILYGRPKEDQAEEDRLYKVHVDDTCVCRNADLEVVNEPPDLKAKILENSTELQIMQEALESWLANSKDEAARERFVESGTKLGIITSTS
jgi:hypothetical protein